MITEIKPIEMFNKEMQVHIKNVFSAHLNQKIFDLVWCIYSRNDILVAECHKCNRIFASDIDGWHTVPCGHELHFW